LEQYLKDQTSEGITLFKEIYIAGIGFLSGKFTHDESKNSYYQINDSIEQSLAPWAQHFKVEINFPRRFKSGVYREFYKSGKIKREVDFKLGEDLGKFFANGLERVFYEGPDSQGNETYTILEETKYKNGEPVGIKQRYSTDGGVMEEQVMEESHGSERKEYFPETGKLRLEEHENWGKEYYESGKLKAEWKNKDYFKVGKYTRYYESGKIEMTATYIDGVNRDGIVNKYFEDGTTKEVWSYDKGVRIFIKKYYHNGKMKKEWIYENGQEKEVIEYDKNGNKKS